MVLSEFEQESTAADHARDGLALARELFPLCRSIAGPAVRRTFDVLESWIPLERHEVPTGTPLFDWEAPREWEVRDAYVADEAGRRVIDWRAHNLHLLNYSVPVRRTVSLDELDEHLHSLPEHPDWIPYRTSYYREQWGFCLRHRDRLALQPGRYEVVIDADLRPGSMTYAECVVPGETADIGIVYTHTCHPSLANDNLTGIVVAATLAQALRRERPRLTWRFVFGPGTVGSLAWLSRNEAVLARVRAGLTVGLLGDPAPITYKRSRRGACSTDRAAEHVLAEAGVAHRIVDFEPYGYDERQFCSPGFDLPVGRLSRSQHGEYAAYHSSGDDIESIVPSRLAESISVAARLLATLDANRLPLNLLPKGEPRLGKRGLYGSIGGKAPGERERAMLWVMSYADGTSDLVDISRRSGLPFAAVESAASTLERAGLVRVLDTAPNAMQGELR